MKLIYGTNIWSHHQLPVATELAKLLGPEKFKLVIFEEVHDERRKMGWAEREDFPWVIGPPRDATEMQTLIDECINADVMVVGDCPREVMEARIGTGKLTLVASERMLKKPLHRLRMVNPRYARGIRRYRSLVNHPHVHALAIGYYAADDLRKIGAFNDRIWNWGYLVDVSATLSTRHLLRPLNLFWCGRMLKWKRVDLLLKAVAKLKDSGCIGECLIVGDGPEYKRLFSLARRLRLLNNIVQFLPSVSFSEIRRLMNESDVYILPSNRHEGWGAVAGEAISEGCVLVANEQAGASKELVVDGETGLLFKDGDSQQLAILLKRLSSDDNLMMRLRQQGWDRMQKYWHPRVAAERLVTLCEGILSGKPPEFAEGPCSHLGRTQELNRQVLQ